MISLLSPVKSVTSPLRCTHPLKYVSEIYTAYVNIPVRQYKECLRHADSNHETNLLHAALVVAFGLQFRFLTRFFFTFRQHHKLSEIHILIHCSFILFNVLS